MGKILSENLNNSFQCTDFSFSLSFSVCLSFPPLSLAHTSLLLLLLVSFISPSFLALFPPCRTRWWKAVSAQSSRSGGEGGSVLLGMEIKASTGELGGGLPVPPMPSFHVCGRSWGSLYTRRDWDCFDFCSSILFRLAVSFLYFFSNSLCLQVKGKA